MVEETKLTYLENALQQAMQVSDLANQLPLDTEGKTLLIRLKLNHLVGYLSGGQSAGATVKVIKQQQSKD